MNTVAEKINKKLNDKKDIVKESLFELKKKQLELFQLCYEIQTETDLCLFFYISGHCSYIELSLAESKGNWGQKIDLRIDSYGYDKTYRNFKTYTLDEFKNDAKDLTDERSKIQFLDSIYSEIKNINQALEALKLAKHLAVEQARV